MAANQDDKQFTLDNVHSGTVYELRQECERRKLALPQAISHASLMQCLIKDLLREKEEAEQQYAARIEEERRDLQARLAQQKAERKKAALERSRLRQEEAAKAKAQAAVDTVTPEAAESTSDDKAPPRTEGAEAGTTPKLARAQPGTAVAPVLSSSQ